MAEDEDDATAVFCAMLAKLVLVTASALRRGEPDYALRLLEVFEGKIRRGIDRFEAERDARQTRH